MKKITSMLLMFAMVLSLCGCGKSKAAANVEELISAIGEVTLESGEAIASAQRAYDALTDKEKTSISEILPVLEDAHDAYAFELSKDAYQKINAANSIVHEYGKDLIDAWWLVVYDRDKLIDTYTVESLLSQIDHLDETSLKTGLAYCIANNYDQKEWDKLSDAEKATYVEEAGRFKGDGFSNFDNCMNVTLWAIRHAYKLNGSRGEAESNLESAKVQLQELNRKYPEYEHYTELIGFYTTVASYLDACNLGSQSFETFSEVRTDYEKDIRDYINALSFAFGE